MAGKGNIIGSTFEDLAAIISLVENKERIGVCLDTAHTFAAGYDLRASAKYDETMAKFEESVGLNYIKAFHVNDSKAEYVYTNGRPLLFLC